jgi:hypothetical protein
MQIHVLSFVEGELPPVIEVPLSTMRTIAESLNRTSSLVVKMRTMLEKLNTDHCVFEDVVQITFHRVQWREFYNVVMGK